MSTTITRHHRVRGEADEQWVVGGWGCRQYKAAHGNDKDYWNELRDRSADHSLPMHYAVRMRKAACIRPLAALGHSCDWKDFGVRE